jgi:hypothetical protein
MRDRGTHMGFLFPASLLLAIAAAFCGLAMLITSLSRAFSLAQIGQIKQSTQCVLFSASALLMPLAYYELVKDNRMVEWPFLPQDIPFYVVYIALCCFASKRCDQAKAVATR